MAERKKLKFTPVFEGPIKGWAINYIHKNYWRVEKRFEFEELVQEAYVFFLVCKKKYPDVNTPQHFMALFKQCLINYFKTQSTKQSDANVVLDISSIRGGGGDSGGSGEPLSFEDVLSRIPGNDPNLGEFSISTEQAPMEVKMFLNALNDENFLKTLQEKYKRTPQPKGFWIRETTNTKFCSALGLDPDKVNLVGMLRDFLAA